MATIKIEGQELTIPDEIAGNDQQLKDAITPFFPQLANALIRRETTKDGQMVVNMTKQAGTKGNGVDTTTTAVSDAFVVSATEQPELVIDPMGLDIQEQGIKAICQFLVDAPETQNSLTLLYWDIEVEKATRVSQEAMVFGESGDGDGDGDEDEQAIDHWPLVEKALIQHEKDVRLWQTLGEALCDDSVATRSVTSLHNIPVGF